MSTQSQQIVPFYGHVNDSAKSSYGYLKIPALTGTTSPCAWPLPLPKTTSRNPRGPVAWDQSLFLVPSTPANSLDR